MTTITTLPTNLVLIFSTIGFVAVLVFTVSVFQEKFSTAYKSATVTTVAFLVLTPLHTLVVESQLLILLCVVSTIGFLICAIVYKNKLKKQNQNPGQEQKEEKR